ncbi:DNA helicase [Paenibacillus sp. Marseille-Q9583]
MAAHGQQLLSKIVDTGDVQAITRLGIKRTDYATEGEQRAHEFVVKYAADNGGVAPSLSTFVAEFPDDVCAYIPGVTDSFDYLARELKDAAGKRATAKLLSDPYMQRDFDTKTTEEFVVSLTKQLERIKLETRTSVPVMIGNDIQDLAALFREEYNSRKAGKSFKLWRTPFDSLNAEIGGLYSGDIYGIMAESGRGKTYVSEVIIDELLRQGAKVLVKSYELKWYQWLARLISIITAREEELSAETFGVNVGLPNKDLLSGKLDEELETYLMGMLDKLNGYYPGNLILQAKGDGALSRTLDELDRELYEHSDIDVVVIDPFYGLADVYGSNANKTAGGAAEQAARRFERIVGEHDVIGIYTIQAQTDKQDEESGEQRELRLPKRDKVKTTKAVLEIATNLFTFDAANGIGRLGVEKGRNGGEGFTVELIALLDYGVLREPPRGAEAVAQFVSGF